MSPPLPKQWNWIALAPILAGLYALQASEGPWSGWFAGLPGALVFGSGFALLTMPGDARVTGYLGFGAVLGLIGVLPMWIVAGFGDALALAIAFAAAFLVAGRAGLSDLPLAEDVPAPVRDWHMDLKVGIDEALIGYFVGGAYVPSGDAARRMCEDACRMREVLDENGWRTDPHRFHEVPMAPADVHAQTRRLYGFDYERLSFDSGFRPREALPRAGAWADQVANRTAAACVWRHPGAPRPWLVCVHGYRMGSPHVDFTMFRRDYLHLHLGLNVLMPVLPLHGSRKVGVRSGDNYLDGDLCELVHAETQTLWDLRRWLAWLREAETQPTIGAYGVSLGGRAVSVLAQYDAGLDFVVAALPLVDEAALLWRFLPGPHRRYFESRGFNERRVQEMLQVCSPLSEQPKLTSSRLQVIGATADRVIPPTQALELGRHWGVPVHWYQGSHLSFRREELPSRVLEQALREAGWRAGDDAYA